MLERSFAEFREYGKISSKDRKKSVPAPTTEQELLRRLWWHNPGKQTNGDKPIGTAVTGVRVKGWLCSTPVGVGDAGKDGVRMLVIPFNSHLSLLFSLPLILFQMLFHLIDTMITLRYIPWR